MPLRKPSDDYNRVGGSRRFARDFNKLNREVARQSDVSLPVGGTNGVDGVTQGAEPARLLVKITAKDGSTPPKYSWTPQIEANAALGDDTVGFAGTDTNFWAYELNGSDVPIGTIVELRPGHGGEYFWFAYTGASSSSSISIYDGTTSQTIAAGDTITFTGGEGVDLTVSATDTVTADLDFPGLSEWTTWSVTIGSTGSTTSYLTTYLCLYDSTIGEHRKILLDKLCQSYLIKNLAFDATPKAVNASDTELQTFIGKPDGAVQDWIFQDEFCAWAISTSSQDLYVQVNLDHSYLSAPAGGVADTDSFLIYDVSQSVWAKLSGTDLKTYIGSTASDSTITITDGTTSQNVVSGDTITFTSGTGVDLTVSATDTVTADLDLAGLSTITFNSAEDYVPVLDGTDSSIKRALLPSYSFTLTGDSGSQTISGSDTMTIAGSNGILTAVTASDTCTVSINIPGLTEETTIEAGDYFLLYDASVAANRKYPASSVVGTGGSSAWYRYDVDESDFTAAALTETITIATLGQNIMIEDMVYSVTETFDGGIALNPAGNILLEDGTTTLDEPVDLTTTNRTRTGYWTPPNLMAYAANSVLKFKVTDSAENVVNYTQGAISIWIKYSVLSKP